MNMDAEDGADCSVLQGKAVALDGDDIFAEIQGQGTGWGGGKDCPLSPKVRCFKI